jgi:hypothetical protein
MVIVLSVSTIICWRLVFATVVFCLCSAPDGFLRLVSACGFSARWFLLLVFCACVCAPVFMRLCLCTCGFIHCACGFLRLCFPHRKWFLHLCFLHLSFMRLCFHLSFLPVFMHLSNACVSAPAFMRLCFGTHIEFCACFLHLCFCHNVFSAPVFLHLFLRHMFLHRFCAAVFLRLCTCGVLRLSFSATVYAPVGSAPSAAMVSAPVFLRLCFCACVFNAPVGFCAWFLHLCVYAPCVYAPVFLHHNVLCTCV